MAAVARATAGWAGRRAFRTDWDKNPPKLLWSVECGGGYGSCAWSVAHTQDRLDGNERVICLNAADGQLLWDYPYSSEVAGNDPNYSSGPRATPTVQGKLVYAVGGAGKLLEVEHLSLASLPTLRWQHDLLKEFEATIPRWGVACSPLIEDDLVIVQPGGIRGSAVAFDRNSGELRWSAGKNPSGYSSPIAATVAGQRVVQIFALTGNALLAVRPDGTLCDSYDWKTDNAGNIATPLVVDDYVFISAAYNKGCALLRAEKQGDGVKLVPVYACAFVEDFRTTTVRAFTRIVTFSGFTGSVIGAQLKCIDFITGREKDGWKANGIGVGSGTLILADKHLIILTQSGDLSLVEATPEEFAVVMIPKVFTGKDKWARRRPRWMAGSDLGRDEVKVVCYDVRP